jgi:hypothetical protein
MEFKFEFTEKEINLILTGLAELPAKMSIEMILKIKQIAKVQIDEFEQSKLNELKPFDLQYVARTLWLITQ